jgi:hypothetical protein
MDVARGHGKRRGRTASKMIFFIIVYLLIEMGDAKPMPAV